MKKKLLAATLSLSILLLGGTALATAQSNQNEVSIQSQTQYASTAAFSGPATGAHKQIAAQAGLEAQADMPGQASATLSGTVTGLSKINGGYAIQVETQSGESANVNTNTETRLIYNGKLLNSSLDLSSVTQASIEINSDGDVVTVNFTGNGQATAEKQASVQINNIDRIDPIDKIDPIDSIDPIDQIDDLDKILKYFKISSLDLNDLFDELDELDELQELPAEFHEELEELDELDELYAEGIYIHLSSLA